MPALSKRLSTIVDFVESKAAVCDVGTDHGYLAIHLIKSGIASKVLATDINEKPLGNALKNIKNAAVSGIELRLCDGLSGIKNDEADTFIIAGMGGEVIAGILEKGANITASSNIRLILQPTTSPEFLRRFLYENGYEIIKEAAVWENSKLYSVMLVCFSGETDIKPESFYYIGKVDPFDEAGLMYIKKQQNRCKACMKSLESIPHKQTDFSHYKTVFCEIEEFLKNFYGEK